jgi:hypothetical protein
MKCGYGQFRNTMAYTTALSSSKTQTRDAIKVEDTRQAAGMESSKGLFDLDFLARPLFHIYI